MHIIKQSKRCHISALIVFVYHSYSDSFLGFVENTNART